MQASLAKTPDHHCGLENWSLPLGEGPHFHTPTLVVLMLQRIPHLCLLKHLDIVLKYTPWWIIHLVLQQEKNHHWRLRLWWWSHMQQLHVLKKPQFVLRVRNSGEVFYFLSHERDGQGYALFPIPLTSSCHRMWTWWPEPWQPLLLSQERSWDIFYIISFISFMYWVGSVCLFPGCKYLYHGWFQTISMMSLNAEVEKEAQ